ncbi:MAG TPA: CocE/NonD family hydrolase [Actinomycetota bacterium]|nr:CocE/NonD family hydrolase [Actinomycetota bacterium]
MRLIRRTTLIVLAAALVAPPTVASAAPHPDADHTEAYFPANDGLGTKLHADILRPKGMSWDVKTPVVMTVSPYTNHGGVPTVDPVLGHVNGSGPSERFYDFLSVSQILKKGYTYVMVDLPGFGGSGGCNDWGGNREQGAVKAAVEWAASEPWSTGKVALMGKSYDAWTGLMGVAQRPNGLAAVVAMEPVYAGYRYGYNNGVRFTNSVLTPALFTAFDVQPGPVTVSPDYQVNGAPQAWCYGVNLGMQQIDDPNDPFWRERDLIPDVIGERTPVFLTQGFLESNTKPDGAFEFWNNLDLRHGRAWFGQFGHWRGWERNGQGRFYMGRSVFAAEMMRFLDHHLKGLETGVEEDPRVAVQDNRGRYRAETQWPPEDMTMWWNDLNTGSYRDDLTVSSTPVWSFSQILPHDVWLSGEPVLRVEVDAPAPRANLVADVFAYNPANGRATLINRGAYLLRGRGTQRATFKLYGQDWRIPAGHRIGVAISDTDVRASNWWAHVPTGQTVTVRSAKIGLPFLYWERDPEEYLDGGSTPDLESHLGGTVSVSASAAAAAARDFDLPERLKPRPKDEDEQAEATAG